METCSNCGTVSSANEKAMWGKISGYHPVKGYTKRAYRGTETHKLIPEYSQHQGWLCPKCMKFLSAYRIEKFTDLKSSPQKKKEKQNPLSLWDAFH